MDLSRFIHEAMFPDGAKSAFVVISEGKRFKSILIKESTLSVVKRSIAMNEK